MKTDLPKIRLIIILLQRKKFEKEAMECKAIETLQGI
jgi:hypothetical protein